MTTLGGGWMLVSTKVSPDFVPWKASSNTGCLKSTNADCASATPAKLAWDKAMWRFSTSTNYLLTFDTTAAAEFTSYLKGGNYSNNPAVGGLTKYVNGVATGPQSVGAIHYYSANGISEAHSGSDQWIDCWNGADGTNNYTDVEGGDAGLRGTKCIAGYCKTAPIWLMVR